MKFCSKCNNNKSPESFSKHCKAKDGLNSWCKDCYNQYRIDNKERLKELNSIWQKANPEKCNANTAKWQKLNTKKCSEKSRIWRSKNTERSKEIDKRFKEKNPDRVKLWAKRWRENNKDRCLVHWRNRHARKKSAEGKYNFEDIQFLLANQKHKCASCLLSVKKVYHVDHIHPLSKGGTNWPDNLQILCPDCNLRKHAKDPIVWANENGRLL